MIKTEKLNAFRGKNKILHEIDFQAKAGEITTIVGPNGSGKTTFMKVLSGDLPYQGKIYFNGTDLKSMNHAQLALIRAVLPQSTSMSFPFLVREVVELGLSSGQNINEEQRMILPERALQKVDLQGYEPRYYQELSGGEQARVQLARVLCQIWEPVYHENPCWLLLDEPVASLDIHHQMIVMQIAQQFSRSGGGVLAILHDLNLAAHYSDKIVLLQQGKVIEEGTPKTVLTTENIRKVYQCNLTVGALPAQNVPFILPQSASY
ncbi:heme ABC transporter ATP-binding protein [Bartonella tamiae]|uniref:ABC transporter domain-containing protein n=1 Tax=Bartonella tamiae Th239 TaxID=1094558 RepID=J0QX42_9HYPH|nr:heme ABC transporter ATP-binding protein [Bartonella tamiae]EJF90611.1 hypothetical protein ME5_01012 [Bartonella tamiae Th239]EJF94011.1 hypothetical protein MEG_00869 [Bartonella tamiae Th307]